MSEALKLASDEFEARTSIRQLWSNLKNLQLDDLPAPMVFRYPIGKRCLLSWLNACNDQPYFYFRTRDQERELAGYGFYNPQNSPPITANQWQLLCRQHPQSDLIRLFFCRNFSTRETWGEFAHMQYFLPRVYCERIRDKYYQAFIIPAQEILSNQDLEERNEYFYKASNADDQQALGEFLPRLLDRQDIPGPEIWKQNVESVLELVKSGKVQKVVLARQTNFTLDGKCDPLAVLAKLMQLKQNVYNFIYSPKPGQSFVGGTPERLFSYDNSVIKTEALAATSNLDSPVQDLFTEKNLLEHNLVVAGLKDRLKDLGCESIQVTKPEVMPLASMLHLHSRMEAAISADLSLDELLNKLHPTAAVCGAPQNIAANLIDHLEPFARGLYAGPIGIADGQSVECAVALRSCLIQENRIALFAGAGIVEGSEANKEWAELDTKMSVLARLFE